MNRFSSKPPVFPQKSGDSRVSFVNLVRNILREETQKLSVERKLLDQFPEGKWLEVVIEEEGERCIDEKHLYRSLSDSKQSIGGVSNRDWWRMFVIWGFYHFWCKPSFQVTRFYLFVDGQVSPMVLKSRVRKVVGFNADLKVSEVECPEYPQTSEGHKSFINKHYKPMK